MHNDFQSFIFVDIVLFEKFKNKTLKITHYTVINDLLIAQLPSFQTGIRHDHFEVHDTVYVASVIYVLGEYS